MMMSTKTEEGPKILLDDSLRNAPYVKNVGIAEKRLQSNGQQIVLVYPAHPNSRIPKNQKQKAAFYKTHKPTISEECIKRA